MKIGVSSQLLEHTRYKRLIVCNESVFDNGSDRGSDTVGRCGSREDPDIQDRSGYRTSMYDAVWDPDGLWTQKAAEELLRNTREYYSAVMMLHKNAEIGQGSYVVEKRLLRGYAKIAKKDQRRPVGDGVVSSIRTRTSKPKPRLTGFYFQ